MLEDEPEVDFGTMILARAYAELCTCKPIGFGGRGPIPWTAMSKWCHLHGLVPFVARHAINTIRHVDSIYMRRDAASKTPKGGS